ncbi:MAG: four helix bundle protein [Patescibacteria group bacterium]
MEKIKSVYLIWHGYHTILPQVNRYTLGNRIDKLFIDIIESVISASFLLKEKKLPYVEHSIRKLDTLKILLMILWETKSINNKRYIALSEPLEEIGRMLGGWNNQIIKQNSLTDAREK